LDFDGAFAHPPEVDVAKVDAVVRGVEVGEFEPSCHRVEANRPREGAHGDGQIDEIEHPPSPRQAYVQRRVHPKRSRVLERTLQLRVVFDGRSCGEAREGLGRGAGEGLGVGTEAHRRRPVARLELSRGIESEASRDARDAHDRIGKWHLGDAHPRRTAHDRCALPSPRVERGRGHRAKIDLWDVRDRTLPGHRAPLHWQRETDTGRELHPVIHREGARTSGADGAQAEGFVPRCDELPRGAHLGVAHERRTDTELDGSPAGHPAGVEIELHGQALPPAKV